MDEKSLRRSLPSLLYTFRRDYLNETTKEEEKRAEVTHCIFFELLRRLNMSYESRDRVAGNSLFSADTTTLDSLLDPTTLPSSHGHTGNECRRYWLARMKLLTAKLYQIHEKAIQYSVASCVNMEKLKWNRVAEKMANTLYITRFSSVRRRVIKVEKPSQKEWATTA